MRKWYALTINSDNLQSGLRITGCLRSSDNSECRSLPPTLRIPSASVNGVSWNNFEVAGTGCPLSNLSISSLKDNAWDSRTHAISALLSSEVVRVAGFAIVGDLKRRQYATILISFAKSEYLPSILSSNVNFATFATLQEISGFLSSVVVMSIALDE